MKCPDEDLVKRCQAELPYRSDAFELLLQRYEPQVFSACQRYLRSVEDAEEASQDALLRVFHALPAFRGEATFKSWLYKIVANVCATRYTRIKTRRARIPEEPEYDLQEFPSKHESEFLPIGGVVGDALDVISTEDRHILILRHVAELTLDELAVALELKLSAAKMRLYRAEHRVTTAYEESRGDPNR